jgi:hypothetical protein
MPLQSANCRGISTYAPWSAGQHARNRYAMGLESIRNRYGIPDTPRNTSTRDPIETIETIADKRAIETDYAHSCKTNELLRLSIVHLAIVHLAISH